MIVYNNISIKFTNGLEKSLICFSNSSRTRTIKHFVIDVRRNMLCYQDFFDYA